MNRLTDPISLQPGFGTARGINILTTDNTIKDHGTHLAWYFTGDRACFRIVQQNDAKSDYASFAGLPYSPSYSSDRDAA